MSIWSFDDRSHNGDAVGAVIGRVLEFLPEHIRINLFVYDNRRDRPTSID